MGILVNFPYCSESFFILTPITRTLSSASSFYHVLPTMEEKRQHRRTLGMFQEVMIIKYHFFPIDFFRTAFQLCFYLNDEKKSMTL